MNATEDPASERLEAQHFTISAFDVPVSVHISGTGVAELAEHLHSAWAWCAATEVHGDGPKDGAAVAAVLDRDEAVVQNARARGQVAGTTLLEVAGLLTPSITAAALEAGAGSLLLLHAAAIADLDTGRTVVLIGPSGSGKSTAARTLSGPGAPFGYVSDETVAFGRDGKPRSFAKPLSLFPPERDWGKVQHPPASLGLRRAPQDLTLAGLLFVERTLPEGEEPILAPLSTHEAIARIAENSSYLGRLERPMLRAAELVQSCGGAHLVGYHDAADLLSVIHSLVARPVTPAGGIESPPYALASSDERLPRWRRRAVQDQVVVDGYAVTFRDGHVVALSPVGATLLALLGDGEVGLTDLSAGLVDRFGEPDHDPQAMVLDSLDALIGAGLVEPVLPEGSPAL